MDFAEMYFEGYQDPKPKGYSKYHYTLLLMEVLTGFIYVATLLLLRTLPPDEFIRPLHAILKFLTICVVIMLALE
jgi:hypothetical protein